MGISFNREWGVSEFHSRTVRGKNENLYASLQVVIAVKVVPSEQRVTLVGCSSLSTEIATVSLRFNGHSPGEPGLASFY